MEQTMFPVFIALRDDWHYRSHLELSTREGDNQESGFLVPDESQSKQGWTQSDPDEDLEFCGPLAVDIDGECELYKCVVKKTA